MELIEANEFIIFGAGGGANSKKGYKRLHFSECVHVFRCLNAYVNTIDGIEIKSVYQIDFQLYDIKALL